MKHAAGPQGFAMRANAVMPVGRPVRSFLAAFIALAMLASLAVAPALAGIASAADSSDATAASNAVPGVCTGKTIHWGGADISSSTVDDGIATYVGGDMYIGKNTGGTMQDKNGPDGSYAVEAEGLTAVKGKLLLHPLKTSWTVWKDNDQGLSDARGFRFGTVGFGAQFRPTEGESVLDVYGQSSNDSLSWVGGAQAWGNAGWIGKLPNESSLNYTANIANGGTPTTLYKGTANDFLGKEGISKNTNKNRWDSRNSVYVPSDATATSTVNWNKSAKDTNIGDTDEVFVATGATDSFGSKIVNMSQNLKSLGEQGTTDGVYVGTGEFLPGDDGTYPSSPGSFDRNKFLSKAGATPDYIYHISSTTETVIKFRGDGTSALQVFNLDSNQLDANTSYSYAFENIPDTASVAINVTGSNAQSLSYHNGWRFWWTDLNNETKELGGSYNDDAYMKRAQQVLWNFPDTTNLTIMGGQAVGKIGINIKLSANAKKDGVWGEMSGIATTDTVATTDDPAAGLLGSVLVPNGSFESHVSTNGRVWVGGDFSMYNPTAVGVQDSKGFSPFVNSERSHSASALDMDQERHNVPWNGAYTAQCATIAWDKVDDSTSHKPLVGTTWAVYGSLDEAKTHNVATALKRVTDGGYGDEDNQADGSLEIGGLNPSENGTTLTYYIREVSANNAGYRTNTNIYAIAAGAEGTTVHTIIGVYDSNGTSITDDAKKLLIASSGTDENDKIINERKGLELDWSKVDKDDTGKTLAGSAWKLQKNGSDIAYHITDTTTGVAKVTIKHNGDTVTKIDLTTTDIADLVAEVTGTNGSTSGVPQTVIWTSSAPGVATVDDSGLITPISVGTTTVKACSVADEAKCASVAVTIAYPPSQIATTTVYYPTSVFGTGVLPTLRYQLGDGAWEDATMEAADCSGWVKTTLENPGKKSITFVVHNGTVWDNNGGSTNNYQHGYAAEITLSGSTRSGSSVAKGTLSTGAPVGCSAIPPAETTTTVYYPTSVFGTGVLPNFQYLLDGETEWVTAQRMEAADCDGWVKYTFKNPDRKGFQFDVYYNNLWDNNGRSNYQYIYSAELTLSGSTKSGDKVTAGTLSSGVPSSCIVTPPSTTETVAINDHTSGDTVLLKQGETLALTATRTPTTTALTWSSGNTSVVTVTANAEDDTKATVKAVAAGTVTIRVHTANGTNASIKIRVVSSSMLRVYFNTSAVNDSWSNGYWLAYQRKSNGIYATVQMQRASCNSTYVFADIPIDQVQDGYGYYFRDNERLDSKRQWYGSNGTQSTGEPFQFPGGSYADLRVDNKGSRQLSAPSGCAANAKATSATRSAKGAARVTTNATNAQNAKRSAPSASTPSAAAQAAATSGVAVNAAANGSAASGTVYSCGDTLGKCDMDTGVGRFRIVDLEAGTYTLTETVAPNGYVETVETYTVTLASDGTVTWNPTNVSDNKVTNTRMRGTVAWRKVAAADDATSGSAGGSGTGGSAGDVGSSVALGGSEWALTKLTSFTWSADGKATYSEITGGDAAVVTITDCVNGQNGVAACSAQTPTESNPYPDLDGAAGRFAITGLDWGEYALKESKAPEGYTAESTGRTFTFGPEEGGNTTGQWYRNSVDSSGIVSAGAVDYDQAVFDFDIGDITNTRTLGSVAWTKVGSDDTNTPLAGSAWKLIRTHRYDAATGGYVKLTSAEEFDVIDCTSSPCPSGAGSTGNTWNDSDSAVGKFKLDQLPWGVYSLVETRAPRGYTPQTEGTSFTIGPASVGSTDVSQQETSQTGLSIQLGEIVNQKTVIATAIPMTGGDWTGRTILAVGGGLAVLAGICAIACKATRRRTTTHA